jgi:hypothetical protein
MKLGFQSGVLNIKSKDTLKLTERTIAQELQSVGYVAVAVVVVAVGLSASLNHSN